MTDRLTPEAFANKVFRKRDAIPQEFIRFGGSGEFWHRFSNNAWTKHPYLIRPDGFELDWGSGNVFMCVWLGTSGEFLELSRHQEFTWELRPDQFHYDDNSSTSSSV